MQVAGHAAMLDDVDGRPNDNCWNTVGFKVPRDQTHGLMTDGSQGHQQRDVYIVLLATPEDVRSVFFDSVALAVVGGY